MIVAIIAMKLLYTDLDVLKYVILAFVAIKFVVKARLAFGTIWLVVL